MTVKLQPLRASCDVCVGLCMCSKHRAEQYISASLTGRRGLLTVQLCQFLLVFLRKSFWKTATVCTCRCVRNTAAAREIVAGAPGTRLYKNENLRTFKKKVGDTFLQVGSLMRLWFIPMHKIT